MNDPSAQAALSPSAPKPIVDLRGVHKSYTMGEASVEILRDASLCVGAGEAVVVRGVSGCGKSTLLNLIGAIDRPSSGELIVCGSRIDTLPRAGQVEFRRNKIGFIFQFYNLLPTLTAVENVMLGLEATRMPSRQARRRATGYLDAVGLADQAGKFPEQLSGGEQQRVAIARALAKESPLVLADEPTGNLDEETGIRVLELFGRLRREHHLTTVVVTHNPEVSNYADRTLVLHNGALTETPS